MSSKGFGYDTGAYEYFYEVTIDDIINFFNNGAYERTIYGRGSRPLVANVRLWIFGQMLKTVKGHLENDRINRACKMCNRIERRCDSAPRPPGYIKGDAVSDLSNMILDLIESECQ